MAIQSWRSGACTVTFDDTTGAVTVNGQGMMEDYAEYERPPWYQSIDSFKSLSIQNGVVHIGRCAFSDCSGFTGNLILPSSITSIGESAFSDCSGFTGDLTIPSGIKSIEDRTFFNCYGFADILTIPSSVIHVGPSGFYNLYSVKKVINYAKIQEIKDGGFLSVGAINSLMYGYPENTAFKTSAGDKWRDIMEILPEIAPYTATLTDKNGKTLYPRTKGAAVYLDNGKTVEKALGGVSFWRGTQAEYDALTPKPANTVYCIIGGSVIVT